MLLQTNLKQRLNTSGDITTYIEINSNLAFYVRQKLIKTLLFLHSYSEAATGGIL